MVLNFTVLTFFHITVKLLKFPSTSKNLIDFVHWDEKIAAPLPFLGVKWLFWNRNLKMIPSEYRDILYLILKILIRPLEWGTARFWTPTGFKNTSRQSWTFEKNLHFTTKTNVFLERSTLTAGIFTSSRSSETYCTSF